MKFKELYESVYMNESLKQDIHKLVLQNTMEELEKILSRTTYQLHMFKGAGFNAEHTSIHLNLNMPYKKVSGKDLVSRYEKQTCDDKHKEYLQHFYIAVKPVDKEIEKLIPIVKKRWHDNNINGHNVYDDSDKARMFNMDDDAFKLRKANPVCEVFIIVENLEDDRIRWSVQKITTNVNDFGGISNKYVDVSGNIYASKTETKKDLTHLKKYQVFEIFPRGEKYKSGIGHDLMGDLNRFSKNHGIEYNKKTGVMKYTNTEDPNEWMHW
jgi:hypothetical protein